MTATETEWPARAYREGLNERAIAYLGSVHRRLSADASPEEVGMILGEGYRDLFDADYCRFWWVNDDRTEARVIAHFPATEFTEPWQHVKRLDDGEATVVAWVIANGEGRIERNAAEIPDGESRFASVYKVMSGCHFPLVVDGRTMGDMVMTSKKETQHFDPADRDLIQTLANVAALAIANAKKR